MKKLLLIAAVASLSLSATAQKRVNLSTYNGTQVEKFAGQTCAVDVNRYILSGWNTLCLPMDVSADQLKAALGADYRLERLVAAEQSGREIILTFSDCKAEGVKAGAPYILYFAGETGNKKLSLTTELTSNVKPLSFTTAEGVEVTMSGAAVKTDGRGKYGILAIDNSDARFTSVDGDKVFYATRCYVTTSGAGQYELKTRHTDSNEITGIADIAAADEVLDVYNLMGQRVAAGVRAADVNNLEPNIYVVKGRKILVK